jgi:pimeloyl-ACP methyl ester carboxylesterase
VVVENGLGDFSFDWILVHNKVAAVPASALTTARDTPGANLVPKPRTFAQINLELRDALVKLHEHGPFVLVGHSYGGPVIRNFAETNPRDVVGMVLVDAAFEGQRVGIGGGKTMRLGEDAKGRSVPPPHEEMKESDKPAIPPRK